MVNERKRESCSFDIRRYEAVPQTLPPPFFRLVVVARKIRIDFSAALPFTGAHNPVSSPCSAPLFSDQTARERWCNVARYFSFLPFPTITQGTESAPWTRDRHDSPSTSVATEFAYQLTSLPPENVWRLSARRATVGYSGLQRAACAVRHLHVAAALAPANQSYFFALAN